jgi:hypothetical protein
MADFDRLVGEPKDGSATLELFGNPADLRAVVMTVEANGTTELDQRQRRHLTAWLTVYAADQVGFLLTSVDTALRTPEDSTVRVGTEAAEIRVETQHETGGTIRLRLVLAPPSEPSPP